MPVTPSIRTSPRTVFSSPLGLVVAVLLGVVLALPSLRVGFYLDDYAQLALVESWYPKNADLFNLYAFLGELPLDPWWKHPDFAVSMWRPFPSALIHLDNRLFGHHAVGYHAHSILWFTAILAAIGLLFSRALSSRLRVLALLIFALDECHILNVGWIANRHAMVAMLPTLLGLYAHVRWREEGWRPGLPLSILGYVVGLFGGEVALGVMAYAVAYELFAGPGKVRQRLVGLVPVCLVAGTYALWYKLMGFGAAHSGFYLDPTGEIREFTRAAASHLPALLAGILLGLPSDLWFFAPAFRPFQIITGTVAFLGFAWLLYWAWKDLGAAERRALRWLLPGAGFALLPAAVAQPFDRVLIAPMIGGAALIAVVLHHNWRRFRQPPSTGNRFGKLLAACLALILVGLHLILPPLNRFATYRFMEQEWKKLDQLATRIPVDPTSASSRDVVLLTAPDIVIGGFLPLVYGFQGNPLFRSWIALSLAPYDHVVTRSGPRTLELSVVEGQMLASPPERFHRSANDKMVRGDVVETAFFQVEVLENNELGPTRVAFRFTRDLEDPGLVFLRWGDGDLEPLKLPAVGESITVPLMSGPMAAALEDLLPP